MEDYISAYHNAKQSSLFNISQSSDSSRTMVSPRSRTIEELLRQKYNPNSNVSKDNSFSMLQSSPAIHLEQVLAKSRFTKRSTDSAASSTPRFMPREVQVSIRDLENKLREKGRDSSKETQKKEKKTDPRGVAAKIVESSQYKEVPKHSLELIQRLREEVRNRVGFLEPEEPPDILEMNVLDRNTYWLQVRKQKIDGKRQELKDKELDGCTFKPVLNIPRLKTPISQRSKSPNTSYSIQYMRRRNFRSNSTGKLSSRSTPKASSRDSTMAYIPAQLSPKNHQIAYKAGFNISSFLNRAQPVVDYKYFK